MIHRTREREVRQTSRRLRPDAWLVGVLAVGVVLRVLIALVHAPIAMNLNDSGRYVAMAGGQLFGDPVQPGGYPLFLRALHALSSEVGFVALVQHVLGLATAVLIFLAVRAIGAPRWTAVLGAAAVALSLDQVFVEHALLTETVFTFLLALALLGGARAAGPAWAPRVSAAQLGWLAMAGAALGLAAWARTLAALLIPGLVAWVVLALPGPWRARLLRGAAVALAGGATVLVYMTASAIESGHFGLSRSGGWAIYARSAPFADCQEFSPPSGTRPLCERTDPSARPGPDFYAWQPESPAQRAFGPLPNRADEVGAFGRAAILGQPVAYLREVSTDFMKYFAPGFDPRPFDGPGYEVVEVDRRAPGVEPAIERQIDSWYDDTTLRIRGGAAALSDLQALLRVQPGLLLLSLILGILAFVRSSGRLRGGVSLLLGSALLLLVLPVATAIFSARYAIPAQGPLVAVGGIGAWLIAHGRPPEAGDVPSDAAGAGAAEPRRRDSASSARASATS